MKAFREWMREQKEIDILVEAAGNLQGLPKKLIKAIINKDKQRRLWWRKF